jgi:hypothetical protein
MGNRIDTQLGLRGVTGRRSAHALGPGASENRVEWSATVNLGLFQRCPSTERNRHHTIATSTLGGLSREVPCSSPSAHGWVVG